MNFNQGLAILAERGFNIFAAIPLRELPAELRTFAPGPELDHFNLCVMAHGGTALWKSLPHPLVRAENPVDAYTRAQIDWFASEVLHDKKYVLAFPREDMLLPLQRLGRFLNIARASILGIDMNLEYGLWFAYRGVLLTSVAVPKTVGKPFVVACESCESKPCLAVPPELNFSGAGARTACPIHSEHRYGSEQMNYHSGHCPKR
ncbi:MAG: hypothetical protein ACXVA9_11180 [Bdellovibrionales bacterium]